MPLSPSEIKAIKNADSVVFHHQHRPGENARDFVICNKRHDPGDGFGSRELTVEFDIALSRFQTYELPGEGDIVWSTGVGRNYDAEWETCRDLLRKDDELVAVWILGNNSDNLRKAGLSHDEFKVEIQRPTTKGIKRMSFHVDDIIAPTYEVGRMATRSTRVFT